MMTSKDSEPKPLPVIPLKESHRFMKDCMKSVGTPEEHAEALAKLLTEADYRGHYSHGMNRLEMYLGDAKNEVCDTKAHPVIIKETPATAWVDGQNGLGVVVGHFCMDLAIQKAKNIGVGWVVTKGSNHYGIAGMYPLQALKEGLIGLSFTGTSPIVAPTRTNQGALGTSPISMGAPAANNDSFLLDMATSAVAMGKIEMKRRCNLPIPDQWAHENGNLKPLGGDEENSGYKGFGLSMLVEIFCGILAGSNYGPNIPMMGSGSKDLKINLGQCFVAIDPGCFAPGFEDRLLDLMNSIRQMDPIDPEKPVLVAGDPEKQHMAKVDKAGGVQYVQDQLNTCQRLAISLNVTPLQPLK